MRSVCNEFNFACVWGGEKLKFQHQREEIRVRGRVESRLHIWLRGYEFWRVVLGVLGRQGLIAVRMKFMKLLGDHQYIGGGGSGGEERPEGAVGYCD